MAVTKTQRREKPVKMEQRQVRGPEWGLQVKQTALLASPIYTGQAQGEERGEKNKKHTKRGAGFELGAPLLFLSFGLACCLPPCLEGGCIFPCFLNKTAVTWSCDTGPSIASNFCCDETELRELQTSPTESLNFSWNKQVWSMNN